MAAVILVWPGALAIGLSLGLLGSGGSILTVPVLVYLVGQDEKIAIAGSLAIVGLISLAGSVPYLRARLIDWRSVVLFGVPGMAGTYLGAWSSAFVSGTVQLATFAVVMLGASYLMLRPVQCEARPRAPRESWRITTDGLVVGTITGFVGVGGGFLIVPALVLLGGLSMHRAVATSLVIIALKSATGFIKYQSLLEAEHLNIDYQIIGLVTLFGIVGSFVGNNVAQHLSTDKLRHTFGYFLIIMGIYVLGSSLPELIGTST
ncbi:MAG: sulfite exporter TauE/SafE family protein [Pseudomonadota bacterium]